MARHNQDMTLLDNDAVDFNDDDSDWEPVQGPTIDVLQTCARDTKNDCNINSQQENKASHHEDISLQNMNCYEDSDDCDREPLQKPTAVAKWFCVNCTMVNFEDVVHCAICGEHRESEILTHGFFASPLKGFHGSKLKVQEKLKDSCLQDLTSDKLTAIGFDERMLLHSEVKLKSHPHPERPDRLRAITASLATAGIFPGKCFKIPSREITREELKTIHSLENIVAVKLSSRMYASYFTSDTYANKHSALAARLAAGLCADLASTIFSGRVKNGFALVRPPGHHAGVNQAMGFCLHNNAAIAASAAQMAGAKRVLIVDWDVHHGNGTQEIFEQNKSVLFISLHRHEGGKFYPGTGAAAEVGTSGAEGYCVNVPWSRGGVGDNDYIFAFQQVVLPIASEFAPDFTIISAGFDAAQGDPLGGCDVTPAGFAQMTEMLTTLSQGKLLVILEGGYNLRSISSSATEVIKVLLGERPGGKVENVVPTRAGLRTVLEVLKIQMIFWRTLEPIFKNILSKWGVHVQERNKMHVLPFGDNSYKKKKKVASSAAGSRPTASFLASQITPPPPLTHKDHEKITRKRQGGEHAGRTEVSKKGKHKETSSPSSVFTFFSSLVKSNYTAEEVKHLSARLENGDELSFKLALGETFFHGLNCLSTKNSQISELEKTRKKYKEEASAHRKQLVDQKKKSGEDLEVQKRKMDRLKSELDALGQESSKKDEAHKSEIDKLKAKLEEHEKNRKKALSDAYSEGFLGFLKSFLGADYNYDWSLHFAKSTVSYMESFKIDYAAEIEEARIEHLAKVQAEEEAKLKATHDAEGGKHSRVQEGEHQNILPSNTVA